MLRGRELKLLYFFLDFLRNVSSDIFVSGHLKPLRRRGKKMRWEALSTAEMMKNLFCGVIETGSCSFYNIQGPI